MKSSRRQIAAVLFGCAALLGCGEEPPPSGCRADEAMCGEACVSLSSDPDHCGACDTECGADEVCESGACSAAGCGVGLEACDRACVDPQTDARHCGGCGTACDAGETCTGGMCEAGAGCGAGETMCGDVCANTDSDERHCGACDAGCSGDETCADGSCVEREPVDPPSVTCELPIEPVDTSSPDHVVGDGSPASCTHAALAAAVAEGGIITFDCGDAEVVIDITAALTLRIDTDTTIDGGGSVVLDGGSTDGRSNRIFEYHSDNYRVTETLVTLQGLTLRNAQAPAEDFTPQDTGSPECAWGYKDGEGGAIRMRDGRLHVIDCAFLDNRAAPTGPDTGGGAIYALGALEVIVVGSSFIGNEGSNGGAIGLLQTDGVFVNSVFEDNRATGTGQNFGGASGCPDFNHAEQGGAGGNSGAIGVDGNSVERFELCGLTLRNNHANELGTISRTPNSHRGTTTIDRCLFEGNYAGDGGGALWMQDMDLTIRASTFTGNTSDGLGAGVRLSQGPHGSTLLIENSTFHANVATGALGGGLVFAGEGTVRNCTFVANEAAGGEGFFGAALVSHGEASTMFAIHNSVFANNIDGHEWTPMTCSVGNPGTPVPLPGSNTIQWPRLRNGPNDQEDNACTVDTTFADPMLGELADNGGPTPTLMPPTGSVVIGAGSACPATDQRGEPRPSEGCAVGAVEP